MKALTCPVPGCNFTFGVGTLGWHTHAMRLDAHPTWHPEFVALRPAARRAALKAAFVREFPEFLLSSFSPRAREKYDSSRPPSQNIAALDLRELVREVLREEEVDGRAAPPRSGEYASVRADIAALAELANELQVKLSKLA